MSNLIFITAEYRAKGTRKWYQYISSMSSDETLEEAAERSRRANPYLEFRNFKIDEKQ